MSMQGTSKSAGDSSAKTEASGAALRGAARERVPSEQEQQLKISALMANLPGMAYRCRNSPGWPMDFASEGAEELTGHPSSAYTLRNPFLYAELIHLEDRDRVWKAVQTSIQTGAPFTIEYRIIDAKGREKHVWERGRLVTTDPGGEALLEGFIIDISERKALEKLRDEKVAQELELQKIRKAESLSRLAGAVAHHFNNKMQAVIGCLELADARMLCMCGKYCEAREELQEGLRAALEASKVSRNLLTYLGKTMVEPKRIDAVALFRMVATSSPPTTATMACEWPEHPLWILANPGEMTEMLLQLLNNAAEAHPGGTIQLRLRKRHKGPARGAWTKPEGWKPAAPCWACMDVCDEGPGIPSAVREQLFDPFFSTKFTGRGLGLAMCLGIVQKMGGGIEVETLEGRGTTFRVWMPCEEDQS